MKNQFIQRTRVGVAGNLINQLMANNGSIPEVGKGATRLHYSDRTCYEVIKVSEDGKTVELEALDAEWDKTKEGGIGHQNWILKPTGRFSTLVWRHNAWRFKVQSVRFVKEIREKTETLHLKDILTQDQIDAVYNTNDDHMNVVEGITEQYFEYNKVNIIFGRKDYYYDWEF